MKTDKTLVDWHGLVAERSHAKRYFDPDHPLDVVYGVDPDGRPMMALLTDERIEIADLSKDVRVQQQMREDGRSVTTWSLLEKELFDTFAALCCDVVDRSAGATDHGDALRHLLSGFAEWQVLLQPSRLRRLSLEGLRGLVAELLVMTRELAPKKGLAKAASHWSGPLGGAQDFTFLTGELHEVKAKRRTGKTVRISSVEQLDPPGDKALTLHVLDLDERSADTEGTINLVTLVHEIRAGLGSHPAVRMRFDRSVEGLGIDLSDPWYRDTWFKPEGHRRFDVTPDFPSLRTASLQPHIVQVKYQLGTQHLDQWALDTLTSKEMHA